MFNSIKKNLITPTFTNIEKAVGDTYHYKDGSYLQIKESGKGMYKKLTPEEVAGTMEGAKPKVSKEAIEKLDTVLEAVNQFDHITATDLALKLNMDKPEVMAALGILFKMHKIKYDGGNISPLSGAERNLQWKASEDVKEVYGADSIKSDKPLILTQVIHAPNEALDIAQFDENHNPEKNEFVIHYRGAEKLPHSEDGGFENSQKFPGNSETPQGWSEVEIGSEDQDIDLYGGEIVASYSAPMEGWDENNSDSVLIIKDKSGKYKIDVYYAFGGEDEAIKDEKFQSLKEAQERAVEIMEEIKEDWDEEENWDDEEEED